MYGECVGVCGVPQEPFTLIFEGEFLVGVRDTIKLGCLISDYQGSFHLSLPSTGIISTQHHVKACTWEMASAGALVLLCQAPYR